MVTSANRQRTPVRVLLLLSLLVLAYAASASRAQAVVVGTAAHTPADTQVESARCGTRREWRCLVGETLVLKGHGFDTARMVIFLGRKGSEDNRRIGVSGATDSELAVEVPPGTQSGRVHLRLMSGVRVRIGRLRVRAAAEAGVVSDDSAPARPLAALHAQENEAVDGVFPIDGPHDMGQSETNRFGGARGHGGHDLFARCGTPLVAVRDAVVQFTRWQERAGHYVVLQDKTKRSYAYMHMRSPSLVKTGDKVKMGQRVGYVGDSGRATGCHLHFEAWTAPGWYTGGTATDPLPELSGWEREHEHP